MKNIAICSDGTWNTPDEKDHGFPVPTNVVRLFNALAETDAQGNRQHRYYHPGVGTDGAWWNKLIDGGTGRGLDRNIMSGYRELCDYYECGDRIFLFGFSRGAYTVRSLAGLIAHAGLLDSRGVAEAELWQRIERIFDQGYRRKREKRADWGKLGWKFRNPPQQSVPIRFLGVWDTVGALGIPEDMALLSLIGSLHDHTFHDTALSPAIQTARHAVALDEMRASFQPTLWTLASGDAKQVWFPGVHADVGGGYRETGLSDIALKWMLDEAALCGLAFAPGMLAQVKPDYRDVLHDSCCGAFALLPTQPRSVPRLAPGSAMHELAIQRQIDPPIHQCPYRPAREFTPPTPQGANVSLDIYALQPWNATGLWLDAGRTYQFTASGEWLDGGLKCGPQGAADGHVELGKIADLAGTVLGKAEQMFRKATGNEAADFRFTRRHENMPWFCLVGAIANGGSANDEGHLEPHESFAIGKGCRYTPKKSGYFYAYANDAWNCYGNNRGRVTLTVS